jgi:hypothetical protein
VGAAARAYRADDPAFTALAARTKKYPGATEPGPAAHFDDPGQLLPTDPPRARNFNFKLANFERATGVKIAARLFAKSPPPGEDAQPGAFMRALATKLGVAQRGAVAAYFADDDDWRVWIGGESTAAFFGRPTIPQDLVEGGEFHRVKEAFLSAARASGKADFEQQKKTAPAGKPPPASQRLKLHADAVIDGLIAKFDRKD